MCSFVVPPYDWSRRVWSFTCITLSSLSITNRKCDWLLLGRKVWACLSPIPSQIQIKHHQTARHKQRQAVRHSLARWMHKSTAQLAASQDTMNYWSPCNHLPHHMFTQLPAAFNVFQLCRSVSTAPRDWCSFKCNMFQHFPASAVIALGRCCGVTPKTPLSSSATGPIRTWGAKWAKGGSWDVEKILGRFPSHVGSDDKPSQRQRWCCDSWLLTQHIWCRRHNWRCWYFFNASSGKKFLLTSAESRYLFSSGPKHCFTFMILLPPLCPNLQIRDVIHICHVLLDRCHLEHQPAQ